MPLQSSDLFVVQRGDNTYKVSSSTLKQEYASTANVHVGINPPNSPVEGDLWWSTLEGNLFIWYDDGDSQQWVDASPAFVEIDYERIEDFIDQSVLDNAVSQIIGDDEITISPPSGKGTVTIGVDLSGVERNISNIDDKLDQEISDRQSADNTLQGAINQEIIDRQNADNILQDNIDLKVDITDFEEDQQRQDDEIERLESIIRDLADRLDQLEDDVAGVTSIDGGYPNAEGVFDEPDTDAGTANPDSMTGAIDGGDAEGYD